MIKKWYEKLLSKAFWRRNWKVTAGTAAGIVIVILIMTLLIGGQQDTGAKEAGIQLEQLAQNIRNHYKTRPDFWGLSTNEVIAKKLYPLSMTAEDGQLKGYFGNPVEIGSDAQGTPVMPTVRRFTIAYNHLSKNQCAGLAANKFDQTFWLGVSGMAIDNGSKEQTFDWSSKDFRLPADKEIVKSLCNNVNNVVFYFE